MTLVGAVSLRKRLAAIKDVRPILRDIQLAAVAEAKRRVPRKTGHLGRSIKAGRVTKRSATVEANARYAAYVEFGTKPHVIRPKTKKALAWAPSGQTRLSGRPRKGAKRIFATIVNHPGTKAQPFLRPAVEAAVERQSVARIVEKWNKAG
jgi:HK97 gp10 family phage protein